MKVLVTGGAGFIGSHLSESLAQDNDVIIVDNLSTGSKENLSFLKDIKSTKFFRYDCTNFEEIQSLCKDVDTIFHFAANPEVRIKNHDTTSFTQNVIATRVMLEAAIKSNVKKFVFASTSTIYGEPTIMPTPENYGPLKPISIYGAAKLASEALVSAYCSSFKMSGIILRFANIIGMRSNHGVIYDFFNKLKTNSQKLEILGDGTQTKSYLHIDDCIPAILLASKNDGIEICNIGSEDQVNVTEIANVISDAMDISPKYDYIEGADGGRGWIGDVKKMVLDIAQIKKLGFAPTMNSHDAVKRTIIDMLEN